MPEAWYPTRWWDWCTSEDGEKEQNQLLLIKISVKLIDNKISWKVRKSWQNWGKVKGKVGRGGKILLVRGGSMWFGVIKTFCPEMFNPEISMKFMCCSSSFIVEKW